MLTDTDAMATIAVRNMAVARNFYEGKLHFNRAGGNDRGVTTYKSGNTTVVVYESQYAGTNKATSATWSVGEKLEAVVRSLKDAGVEFEHYELAGARREGDIHVFGNFKAAWFKDPDGNILHINSA